MKRVITHILLALSDLSLPVVIGGAFSFAFFAKLHQVDFFHPIMWACCSGIFAIYLYDHLSDLKKQGIQKISFGAPFWILLHFKKIWISIAFVSLLSSVYFIYTQMHTSYILPGGVSSLLVLGYFIFRKYASNNLQGKLKELWVSLVTTTTLGGITAWVSNMEIQWIFLLSFFLICFQNMLIFSWLDYEKDLENNSPTMAVNMGIPFVVWVLDIFALINLALIADHWYSESFSLAILIFILMQLQLLTIRILCEYKGINRIYRFWTDIVFVIPIIYFL